MTSIYKVYMQIMALTESTFRERNLRTERVLWRLEMFGVIEQQVRPPFPGQKTALLLVRQRQFLQLISSCHLYFKAFSFFLVEQIEKSTTVSMACCKTRLIFVEISVTIPSDKKSLRISHSAKTVLFYRCSSKCPINVQSDR